MGYNHPIYGQAGLEASLDEYLRGLRGNPAATIWWNHLLYGMSPNGLDVRLSMDLTLQARADELMTDHTRCGGFAKCAERRNFRHVIAPHFQPQ